MKDNCIWQPGSIHGDEYYTLPRTAEQVADNLVKYHLKVWMPFNDTNSVWGGALRNKGHEAIATDTDFFETEPPQGVNCIISNPPFSRKLDVLQRTRELKLPFVYILPFTWLNDSIPLEYGHQLMFWRKRMHFKAANSDLNRPRSNCFVLSNGLLTRDLTVIWE